MVEIFSDHTLIQNNRDRDRLDTEQQVADKLRNKVVLLYFGSGSCPRCQRFSPRLREFTVRLLDELYVERAAQLALIYVSQDPTERLEKNFLKTMSWKWLTLPFADTFKSELLSRYAVQKTPTVIVLRPDGEVITREGVTEINARGVSCFTSWWEASHIVDRNFLLPEDFEPLTLRSLTHDLRKLKYKIETRGGGHEGENGE